MYRIQRINKKDQEMNEFIIPENIKDALKILEKRECIPFAGGTDLMVKYRFERPEKPFVFIGDLKELRYIKRRKKILRIGSCVKYYELIKSDIVPDIFKDIIKKIGSPSIRNMGTIGGNICNASPAADTLPFLYAMDAEIVLCSLKCEKILPIYKFIKGPKEINKNKDEILKEIRFSLKRFNRYYYKKVGLRNANSLSKISFFGCLLIKDKKIKDVRISIGAVAPSVVRDRNIEEMLIGLDMKEVRKIKDKILERYSELIKPIDDQRSTAAYRRETSLKLIENFLLSLYS